MNSDLNDKKKNKQPDILIGTWLAIGAGVGAGIGVVIGNIAEGVAIGVGVGVAIGAGLRDKTDDADGVNKRPYGRLFHCALLRKSVQGVEHENEYLR
jgi:hypothetical protein